MLMKLKKITKLSLITIRRHLRFASNNGICSYDKNEEQSIRRKNNILTSNFARNVAVKCNETDECFPNMKLAGENYKCNVSSYFYQNRSHAGMLEDGTLLTWSKITKDEYLKYLKSKVG